MKVVTFLGILILVAVIAIVAPLFIIWAINTLFGLVIVLNFQTWLALLVLIAIFGR